MCYYRQTDRQVLFLAVLDSLLTPFRLGSKLCVTILAFAVLICHCFDWVPSYRAPCNIR